LVDRGFVDLVRVALVDHGRRAVSISCAMKSISAPSRDLTDPGQNQAVLDLATDLSGSGDPKHREHGPAVTAEALAAARSRRLLRGLTVPVHLTVVWAMYGETGRMVPRTADPHGEDFVRMKVRQLDWLTAELPTVTWSIIACDDGCPDQPSSAQLMAEIAAAEGYPTSGHRSVSVLKLAEVIAGGVAIGPAFDRLTTTDQSRKGGSILAALDAALRTPPPVAAAYTGATARHVICYTDADLSANLAGCGSPWGLAPVRPRGRSRLGSGCGGRVGTPAGGARSSSRRSRRC
jgi:hypothetical protein